LIRSLSLVVLAGITAAGLSACESTQDKAARIQAENAKQQKLASMPLTIPKADSRIKVLGTTVLTSKDATVVVVTLKNTGSQAVTNVPVVVNVIAANGKKIDTNATPGLEHWLNHIPILRPGQTVDWMDDQFTSNPAAKSATVQVGIGKPDPHPQPDAVLSKQKFFVDPVSGTELNGKATNLTDLLRDRVVVYSVGRQGGRVVTAGRGVIDKLLPKGGKPSPFTIFFVGTDPRSAQLKTFAPPVPEITQ